MKTTFKKKLEAVGIQVLGLLAREFNREVRSCHDCQRIRPHHCPAHTAQKAELDSFKKVIMDHLPHSPYHVDGKSDGKDHYIKPSYYTKPGVVKKRGRPKKT